MCNTRSTKNENVAHISLKNVFGRQPSFLWAIYAILRKKIQFYRFTDSDTKSVKFFLFSIELGFLIRSSNNKSKRMILNVL